jgi:cytochrome c biogenesis protein CcmG/thiol:disulfide interchange protein DsbE
VKYLLLGLCALGVFTAAAAADLPPGLVARDGAPAPTLRLSNMEGKVTDLRDLRGQWVMVHFWATWCGPCRKEMPTLQSLVKLLPTQRLRILLVNTAFLGLVAPDLDTLMDRDGKATEQWQPRGLPSSFLIDPDGRQRYLALGGRDWATEPYPAFLRQITQPPAVNGPGRGP